MLVQQRRPIPGVTAPSPGLPALCDVGALPGGVDGSQPATHGVAPQGLGCSSAFLAMQLQSPAAPTPSAPAPMKAKQKVAGGGSSAPDAKRKKSEQSTSRALDVALPPVEASFRGESGVQGKSVLQVCHSWKTQHDAKFLRREIS